MSELMAGAEFILGEDKVVVEEEVEGMRLWKLIGRGEEFRIIR